MQRSMSREMCACTLIRALNAAKPDVTRCARGWSSSQMCPSAATMSFLGNYDKGGHCPSDIWLFLAKVFFSPAFSKGLSKTGRKKPEGPHSWLLLYSKPEPAQMLLALHNSLFQIPRMKARRLFRQQGNQGGGAVVHCSNLVCAFRTQGLGVEVGLSLRWHGACRID